MTQEELNHDSPATGDSDPTTVGGYFVANYPPFEAWSADHNTPAQARLDGDSGPDVPLGIYVHIPFCRKRCDFCSYRVYTDKDSENIRRYLAAVITELRMLAERPLVRGRLPSFIFFGGGTPSYLSVAQIESLFEEMQACLPWDQAEEVSFECEPGTLQEKKIEALSRLGVTRLSLGIENFDPEILEINNRAHRAKEIDAAYNCAQRVGFPQINIDLIAGMVGETDENWRDCIARTKELDPDSVTIYQMEIPHNSTIYRQMREGGEVIAPVAEWPAKRRWVNEAFCALEDEGYTVDSAYTATRSAQAKFLYRDELWQGADMLGVGVSSFSYLNGAHLQNDDRFESYIERVEGGELPTQRAWVLSEDEKLIREFVLQMKLGETSISYFQEKFGVDPRERFAKPLAQHQQDGYLSMNGDKIRIHREGLLQIDRLLHAFFLESHRTST
ncbi:MAG: coproporphyrinogen-III oxidase family protein [Planctomycetota bacterium]|jgi:oxygen-independent coproporphyrinogen-3 oxidase|nr:coproporphyrinogen-III oxidase family protein [Planctomycetota bacterium]